MATIGRNFTALAQIIGAGDTYEELAGTAEELSSSVDLTGAQGAHVVVEVNFDGTPTDDVIVNTYGSLDGAAFDDVPYGSFLISNETDPAQVSFAVQDLAHFRIGMVQNGSTDGHDVRAYVRTYDYTSA